MRGILACNLQFIVAIIQIWTLAGLITLIGHLALQATLRQDLLTTLRRRMSIWAVARVLSIARLLVLTLHLIMKLPELHALRNARTTAATFLIRI